jgi:hypothetical protein
VTVTLGAMVMARPVPAMVATSSAKLTSPAESRGDLLVREVRQLGEHDQRPVSAAGPAGGPAVGRQDPERVVGHELLTVHPFPTLVGQLGCR